MVIYTRYLQTRKHKTMPMIVKKVLMYRNKFRETNQKNETIKIGFGRISFDPFWFPREKEKSYVLN